VTRLATLAVLAVLCGRSVAHADGGFLEADVGVAAPIGGDQYDSDVGNSFKLGVRVGTTTKFGGLDVGADFTPYSDELSNNLINVDIERYRFLFGGRYVRALSPKARLFVRGAAGLDLIHYHASGSVIGIDFDNSETDAGIGFEISTGVLLDIGRVAVGAKLGLPFGFHFNGDDPNDPNDADLDYTAVDIDFAFVVAVPF